LRSKGLLGASTREIAREAGVADGTLYVHFSDRIELFLALLDEQLPPFIESMQRLRHLPGRKTVRGNLTDVIEKAMAWQKGIAPLFAALSADPALCRAFQTRLAEQNRGPHLSIGAVERYLTEEQKLGRVRKKADLKAASMLVFAASNYWLALQQGSGYDVGITLKRYLKGVMDQIMAGLEPPKSERL
jgi:AcrR family transcriptional regulator